MKLFYTVLVIGFVALLANSVKCSEDGAAAESEPHSVEEEHSKEDDSHHGPEWGYNKLDSHGNEMGTNKWSKMFAEACGDARKRQSPINIEPAKVKYDPNLAASHIDLLMKTPNKTRTFDMNNNGHSAVVSFAKTDIFVSGGGLKDVFKVHSLHFHWGGDVSQGSEHRINNKMFPLEMHIVNYDTERYSDLGEAVGGTDSLAVLGVFFEEAKEDNPALNPIFDSLNHILEPGQGIQIPHFDLKSLVPENRRNFYRYLGSLTTPTCNEVVVWTVFNTPLKVSKAQLDKLRALHEGKQTDGTVVNLYNNYRPPQPLHGRQVMSSFVPQVQIDQIKKQEREKAAKATKVDANSAPSLTRGILVIAASILAALAL